MRERRRQKKQKKEHIHTDTDTDTRTTDPVVALQAVLEPEAAEQTREDNDAATQHLELRRKRQCEADVHGARRLNARENTNANENHEWERCECECVSV